MKPVHMKKFNVCGKSSTSNVCNTVVCVCTVNIGYDRSTLASHNHNLKSMFNMPVFRLVVDLAAILVFITVQMV